MLTDSSLPTATGLTAQQVLQFHETGWLGPFPAMTPQEMAPIREHVLASVLTTPGPNRGKTEHMRHMDDRVVFDLVSRPAILASIRSILGNDLLLWASNFWLKQPGGAEIPWHQDGNYWPLEPVINLTAWIALDRVTPENACLEIIPGSHKSTIPHVKAAAEHAFPTMADPGAFDPSQKVQLPMEPGEFVLFNERTLHHSEANHSRLRRLAIGPRFTVPIVRVSPTGPLWPDHACILVSGEDRMGFNPLTAAPPMLP